MECIKSINTSPLRNLDSNPERAPMLLPRTGRVWGGFACDHNTSENGNWQQSVARMRGDEMQIAEMSEDELRAIITCWAPR